MVSAADLKAVLDESSDLLKAIKELTAREERLGAGRVALVASIGAVERARAAIAKAEGK
jgi:hypothetical protein